MCTGCLPEEKDFVLKRCNDQSFSDSIPLLDGGDQTISLETESLNMSSADNASQALYLFCRTVYVFVQSVGTCVENGRRRVLLEDWPTSSSLEKVGWSVAREKADEK